MANNRPKFLKNLLTTASALAVLAGGASSAMGIDLITTGNPAQTDGGQNIRKAAAGAPQVPAVGDVVFIGNAAHVLEMRGANNIVVDLFGNNSTLQFGRPTGLFSIRNTFDAAAAAAATAANGGGGAAAGGAAGAATATIELAGGNASYHLNQASTNLVSTIDLQNNALTIDNNSNGVEFRQLFTDTAGNGSIVVDATSITISDKAGGGTAFDIAGATKIKGLTINDGKRVVLNTDIKLLRDIVIGSANAGTAVLEVNGGKNIAVREIMGDAAGKGTLRFNGASRVAATIGTTNKLALIEINNGVLEFKGTAAKADIKATAINLNHANAGLKLSTRAQAVEGDISTTTDLTGVLQLDGDFAHSIAGKVGVDNNHRLAAINFTAAGANSALELLPNVGAGAAAFNVNQVTTDVNGKGTISFGANAAQTITGTIGTAGGNKLASVVIHSDDGAGNAATTVTLTGNDDLTKASKIYATTVDLAGAAQNNILILGQNTLIDGKVSTGNANNGIIQVNGNSTITGTIGEVNVINSIKFIAAKKLTVGAVGANAIATNAGIDFNNLDGTLELTGANDITITSKIITGGDNKGSITANNLTGNKTLTITGQIGDVANNSLGLIQATNGGNIELNSVNAHIKKIDIGANDAKLILSKVGNYKIVEFAHENGRGRLEVANGANATLKAGTVLSNADNKLNQIEFKGNDTLTLEDEVNLYTVNGIKNAGAAQANLIFGGASIVSGKVGVNNTFGNIQVTGANKIVTFLDEVNSAGAITVVDTATVQFKNNVNAAHIKGTVIDPNGKGIVEFVNENAIKVDAEIGNTNKINTLKISGGDVEITKALNTGIIAFSATPSTLQIGGDLGGAKVTTAGNLNNKIAVSIDQVILAGTEIGTANNSLFSIHLLDNKTVEIKTDKFYSGVTTKTNNTGKVTLSKTIFGSLGDDQAALEEVNITDSLTINGDVFAKNVNVAAQKVATFTGDIAGDQKLNLGAGANSAEVVFTKDNANVAIHVVTALPDNGKVSFTNGATVFKIGTSGSSIAELNFNGTNKNISLNDEIFARTINFANSNNVSIDNNTIIHGDVNARNGLNLALNANLTLDGATTANNANINLSTKEAKFTGGKNSALTGNLTINTTYSGVDNYGSLVVDGNGTKLDASRTTATLNVNDVSTKRASKDGDIITVVYTQNGGQVMPTNDISVSGGNLMTKWVLTDGDAQSIIKLKRIDNSSEGTKSILDELKADKGTYANAEKIINRANTGKAEEYSDELFSLVLGGSVDKASFKESIERFEHPIVTGTQAVATVIGVTTEAISSRISSVAAPVQLQVAQGPVEGVAAGDSSTALTAASYGAWGSPFYSQGVQKMRKGVSGYKVKSYGGTLGFDTMANDTMTIGVALTAAKTDLKHKNINAGDKTKADTLMFSIYGIQQVTDNWFVQGIASFGSSKIKNSAKRIGALNGGRNVQTASAKYDSMSYGGEVLAGYNFKLSEMALVTPMFGLGYTKFNDSGYTETGTRNQNQTVSKKSTDKLEAIIGARVVAAGTDMNGIIVTPEVHGFIRQALTNKTPKVDMRLDGLVNQITPKTAKAAKTFYNVGLGLNARAGMMEYGASYDAHLANKYVGHQGTLKVRVNF